MFFLLLILLPAFTFVVLYLVGRVKPLDQVYMFFCGLLSVPLHDITDLLSVFKERQLAGDTKHPGLRTIILIIFLFFALTATMAASYNDLDAIPALFGGVNLNLPTLPPIFGYSMGFLYLSISVLFGGLYAEKYIPEEARVFTFQEVETEKKFTKFVSTSFWLSLVATVAFFADRAAYLNDSPITPLLQFTTFILLAVLTPLLGFVSIYLIARGIQVILSLALTLVWFVSSVSSHCLEYTHKHYLELALAREVQRSTTHTDTTVEAIPENEPVTVLPSPAPFAGRERKDFPIIDNGKPGFAERVNWALDQLEKLPHRLQEVLEYLPKIEWDSSLTDGNWWRCVSNGMFGYDLSDDETTLFVIAHETGHNYQQVQYTDSSEDAANRYAHEVMVELGRA